MNGTMFVKYKFVSENILKTFLVRSKQKLWSKTGRIFLSQYC